VVLSRRPKLIHQLRGAAGPSSITFTIYTVAIISGHPLSLRCALPSLPSAKIKENSRKNPLKKKMTHKDSEWNRLIQFRVLSVVPQQSRPPRAARPASQFKRRWGASRALIQSNSFHAILRLTEGWAGGWGGGRVKKRRESVEKINLHLRVGRVFSVGNCAR